MPPTALRALLAAILALSLVGVADAAIGRRTDLTVLFAGTAALATVGLVRTFGARRHLALRADLAAQLVERARRTGEPLDQLTDRAVATYVEALAGRPPADDPPAPAPARGAGSPPR